MENLNTQYNSQRTEMLDKILEGKSISFNIKTLTGETFGITIIDTNTVRCLAQMLQDRTGIQMNQQRLIVKGRQMDFDSPLSRYNIQDTVNLVQLKKTCRETGNETIDKTMCGLEQAVSEMTKVIYQNGEERAELESEIDRLRDMIAANQDAMANIGSSFAGSPESAKQPSELGPEVPDDQMSSVETNNEEHPPSLFSKLYKAIWG